MEVYFLGQVGDKKSFHLHTASAKLHVVWNVYIIYRDLESGKIFHFVTSDFKSSATEIAEIYRKRWAVELLFKWLKGHLRIRHLGVKSPNLIVGQHKVQLAASILVQLLLKLKHIKDKYQNSLWDLLRQIRSRLIFKGLDSTGFQEVKNAKPLTIARVGF